MSASLSESLSLGLSPCPNDTYIFHALLHGLVPAPVVFRPHLADVEELNGMARRKELDVTKMSLGAFARIMDDYALLASGAALGWGCGPLVVACGPLPPEAWATARVAVPGMLTTANLLLTLHGGFQGPRQEMLFNEVMPAVARGDADLGVIIHEGRFTYQCLGLTKLLDLGEWWEDVVHMPLPLGAIAVRRDVPLETARAVQTAIADSLFYARAHPQASGDFVRVHAQELEESVTLAHIETFVTDYSLDLGEAGRAAIEQLVGRAAALEGLRIPPQGLFLG
ncbi:1,4-dihydroxy-6-naphthoate synthase [uncultured Desulfovibrio sp.]|uniref:1,4-dihydroxy-6-naphthoate synthase n=1 Tax=uncultured Desulfovibrio sp. TaxID=167968 RepID=UPI0003B40541|nr:1,4-dihydroxy-6-naphthoate synthase [uncultured Desulfovibrio sp.]